MKKTISTDLTKDNIARVLEMLGSTTEGLERYAKGRTPAQLTRPLGKGERSPNEVLAHILHCEARSSEAIYLALLEREPEVVVVHAERQWGKLVRYDLASFSELLDYFKFRRAVMLRVLSGLKEAGWARKVRQASKQRQESVYWQARGQATHEEEHLQELERSASMTFRP